MLMVSPPQIRIRPPPVDDVNKLRHDWRCQRCFAPRTIHIRRNALFTSPEYALTAFSGRSVGINVEELAHFALGIAWRTSVHQWTTLSGQRTTFSLGAWEEPIRQYLAGESALASNICVAVTCASDPISRITVIGAHQSPHPYINFALLTRGIWFDISVGDDLPDYVTSRCCLTTADNVVFLANCEPRTVQVAGGATSAARVARNVRTGT
jgi:hypothetical protein